MQRRRLRRRRRRPPPLQLQTTARSDCQPPRSLHHCPAFPPPSPPVMSRLASMPNAAARSWGCRPGPVLAGFTAGAPRPLARFFFARPSFSPGPPRGPAALCRSKLVSLPAALAPWPGRRPPRPRLAGYGGLAASTRPASMRAGIVRAASLPHFTCGSIWSAAGWGTRPPTNATSSEEAAAPPLSSFHLHRSI